MLLNAKPELLFYHNVKKYSLQVEPYAWKVICQGGIERRRSSVYHRHERCFGLQHHFAAFPNVAYDFMEFGSSWKVDSVGVIQRVSTRSNMNILFDASSLPDNGRHGFDFFISLSRNSCAEVAAQVR